MHNLSQDTDQIKTPTALLADEKFTQAFPSLIRALNGDVLTAVVLQSINYRSHITKPDDSGIVWVDLRVSEIADEIGISKDQAQRALNKLRSYGLLMEKQHDGYNNMKLWRIDTDGLREFQLGAKSLLVRNRVTNKADTHQPRRDIAVSTYIEEDIRTLKETTLTYGDENHQACNLLADLIQSNGSKRPAVNDKWLSDMERLHKIDERSWEQITKAIEWCQADDFWRGNILSPAKLRKQYDQLRLAAQRNTKQSKFSKTMDWLNNLENETKELEQ
jgi:hypothetical protein